MGQGLLCGSNSITFSDSIHPYKQFVSVLCTLLSFKSFICDIHIVQAHAQLHKKTNSGVCNHLYVGLLFVLKVG